MVLLSGIINPDGSPLAGTTNKMLLSLVHIAPDQTVRNNHTIGFSAQTVQQPALHVKLQLLCTANFQGENYTEGLNMLSLTMKYFQTNPVITDANTAGAQAGPVKIQPANLSAAEIQQLWIALGAKYLPSVVYEVAMAEV